MGTAVRDLNPNVYPPQHFVRVSSEFVLYSFTFLKECEVEGHI